MTPSPRPVRRRIPTVVDPRAVAHLPVDLAQLDVSGGRTRSSQRGVASMRSARPVEPDAARRGRVAGGRGRVFGRGGAASSRAAARLADALKPELLGDARRRRRRPRARPGRRAPLATVRAPRPASATATSSRRPPRAGTASRPVRPRCTARRGQSPASCASHDAWTLPAESTIGRPPQQHRRHARSAAPSRPTRGPGGGCAAADHEPRHARARRRAPPPAAPRVDLRRRCQTPTRQRRPRPLWAPSSSSPPRPTGAALTARSSPRRPGAANAAAQTVVERAEPGEMVQDPLVDPLAPAAVRAAPGAELDQAAPAQRREGVQRAPVRVLGCEARARAKVGAVSPLLRPATSSAIPPSSSAVAASSSSVASNAREPEVEGQPIRGPSWAALLAPGSAARAGRERPRVRRRMRGDFGARQRRSSSVRLVASAAVTAARGSQHRAGSNRGGSGVRSSRRLSTPSTRSRARWGPPASPRG